MSRGLIEIIGSVAMAVALIVSFGSAPAATNTMAPRDRQAQTLPGVVTSVKCLAALDHSPLGY